MAGAVPKRESKRRNTHTAKDRKGKAVKVRIPRAPAEWNPTVKAWYAALRRGPQAGFYEEPDWHLAITAGHVYQRWLEGAGINTLSEFRRIGERLMITEADRRRAHIEVERTVVDAPAPPPPVDYRARLGLAKEPKSA